MAGSVEGELAEAVFVEADRQARDVPGLPLLVLRAAAEAAGKVGDQAVAEHYQKLRDAERQRIDAALARKQDAKPRSRGVLRCRSRSGLTPLL
ncbi:hypothetical protein [Saccharomonospora cyanea]|uniref:hypothetical protein n=1 Tax=Saccharomonospora cyanea TaxID=40989 RepID=UPI0002E4A4F3|nr:hypothetical protein [Saccharomonospora cyanea]